ncbi:MAG TPA: superoxide dismutase family protein [Candidatus Polarisedimenticolaceae bacterium]
MRTTVLFCAAMLAASPAALAKEKPPHAKATIEARSGSAVKGEAHFKVDDGGVEMKIRVTGLTPGPHAVHLHEKGDCSAPDAATAGGHWNPTGAPHGKWGHESKFHHGDIGNLVANAQGEAELEFETTLWTIGGDPGTNVVGKSVVIHEKVDDFTTQPTGAAGARIGCGVIR